MRESGEAPRVWARGVEHLLSQPDGRVWTERGTLDPEQAQLLGALQSFGSLQEHARALQQYWSLESGSQAELLAALQSLDEQAWLISEEDIYAPSAESTATPISTCAFLTHNRPASLRRALQDLGKPAADHNRRVLVSDDAEQSQPAGLPDSMQVEWISREDRRRWIESLPSGEYKALLSWALLPEKREGLTTFGSSSNTVQIAAAGEGVAMLDDDVCGPVGRAPQTEPRRWSISGPGDPSLLLLYDDADSAIADLLPAPMDAVGLLETQLGQTVAGLGAELGGQRPELDRGLAARHALSIKRGGRVLSTMMGFAGDSGMGSPQWYLGLRGDAGRQLDRDYAKRILSRNLIRSADCFKLSQSDFFMNACSACDLREPLVPYFPAGRNSDELFSASLRAIAPEDFRLYIPYVVAHHPPEDRAYQSIDLARPLGALPPIGVLLAAVRQWRALEDQGGDRGHRRQTLGLWLQGLAAMPPARFREWLQEQRLGQLTGQINWLNQLLDTVPPHRHGHIQGILEQAQHAVGALRAGPESTLFAKGHGQEDYQEGMQQFGRLLESWAAIVQLGAEYPLQGTLIQAR